MQQVEVKYTRFENGEIPFRVANIIPRVIHLTQGVDRGELLASLWLGVASRTGIVPREIQRGSPKLVVHIAGEIPIHVPIGSGDGGVGCLRDIGLAVLIHVLEHERDIGCSCVPVSDEDGIRLAIEVADFGVMEVGEIVVVPMYDDGAVLDRTSVVTIGRFATHSLGETEGKETDACHKGEDDTEEAHFLTPCTLLFGGADTTRSQENGRNEACQNITVDEPGILGTWSNVT